MPESLSAEERREVEARIREHLRRERLITGALMAGVLVMVAAGSWVVVTGYFERPPLAGVPPAVTWAVALYVLASVLASGFVEGKVADTGDPGAGADDVLEAHMRGVVVGMALREGPALLGAIWGMLGGSLFWILVLGLPPVLAMALAWPRRADIERRLQRAADEANGPGG